MKKFSFFSILFLLNSSLLFSQVAINIDGSPPDSSSILDVNSTNKGVLIPRMNFEQRNAIRNPGEGLIVYCSNCTEFGSGVLSIYLEGIWQNFLSGCPAPLAPVEGTHIPDLTQITWNWNPVPIALGYKWSAYDDFNTATDMGLETSMTETGLTCGPIYTRYVWSYNNCGHSLAAILSQATIYCWSCGDSLTINHVTGRVSPFDKTVTYGTVNNIPGETSKCWITSNLGADHQADAVNDASNASAGWYWQFNQMQGYEHSGTKRTPSSLWKTPIDENINWQPANDPCALEINNGWRLPTITEWSNLVTGGSWTNWNGPWNSALKLHAAGYLGYSDGVLSNRGVVGHYWSISQGSRTHGFSLGFNSGSCGMFYDPKASGFTIRCIRD
jgi:hypothetical protein